ncbi:unnamed protein product [Durusdinium trenchii]|uniref:Major facilitator superfamily (MFS) profile domain-containing protein n=2 Tax=Durusdinium trenchii TaxID=1381693 RepID=A0ABP0QCZ2_9DINO
MSEGQEVALFNRRLFIIGIMRLIDSMNVTMIMPYGVQMVARFLNQDTANPQVSTAFAWLVGLYSFFEIVFSPFWGVVADRYGRRPCLLIGMAGTGIATILLSLGPSLTAVFLFRAMDGFFCGNQAVLRTYLGELVDKSNEAHAFSFLVLFFVLGFIVGPLLGALAFPARWAPQVFGGTLFEQYPVLLPNLLFGVFTAIVCIIGFVYLEETLPKSKREVEVNEVDPEASEVTDGQLATEVGPETAGQKSCYALPVLQVIVAFCGIAGAVEAQNTLVVLLWQYPQALGGFGFSPQQVSLVQISGGVGPILCHLTFGQPLVKRLGFLKVLVLGFVINSLAYNLYPVYSLLADPKYGLWRYVILGLAEFIGMTGTFMLFSPVFVFLNRASIGLNRATVNGWANSGRALSRAISPLVASQLLHVSETWPLGRHMPFYVTSACLAFSLAISWSGLCKLN